MFKHSAQHLKKILLTCLLPLAAGSAHALDMEKNTLALPVCINDRCAVINQDGVLLIPFDHHYSNIMAANERNIVFAADKGMWHLVSADGKKVLKANISDQIATLTPDYFRFGDEGKMGIIRSDGKQIAPPKLEYVFVDGNNPYMVYESKGKLGLLNAQGVKISETRFDAITTHNSVTDRASLLTASNDDGRFWLINLKTSKISQVKFSSLDKMEDGHLIARSPDKTRTGLVNEKGQLVIDLKYHSLGTPSGGLISFKEQANSACGYLDYRGQVVIAAKFYECLPFGEKEALAREKLADGRGGKFGPINRQGTWVRPPSYDKADLAGIAALGMSTQVKGLLSIATVSGLTAKFGLYSTDEGKEIMPIESAMLTAISPDWFAYSTAKTPQVKVRFMGNESMMPAVGIMGRNGKQLVAPSGFIHISLDASGRYFRAMNGIDKHSKTALYDLNGKLLVPPNWEMLEVDTRHNIIKAYERIIDGSENGRQMLRAIYNSQGQALITVKTLPCGAQQALDGKGAVIWPAQPEKYCPYTKQ